MAKTTETRTELQNQKQIINERKRKSEMPRKILQNEIHIYFIFGLRAILISFCCRILRTVCSETVNATTMAAAAPPAQSQCELLPIDLHRFSSHFLSIHSSARASPRHTAET